MVTRCVALILLAISAAGCAPRGRREPAPASATTLRVENQGFADMNIYAVRSSQRIRLGTATAHETSVFTIPSNLLFGATPLRFLADPIGGTRAPITDEITVIPGDQVTMIIPPS